MPSTYMSSISLFLLEHTDTFSLIAHYIYILLALELYTVNILNLINI